ncbi:hypothetical protein L1887_24824 [Cichorium endivia]|nr:hypothetical protein L1887_24824 [Cichorium endivia]
MTSSCSSLPISQVRLQLWDTLFHRTRPSFTTIVPDFMLSAIIRRFRTVAVGQRPFPAKKRKETKRERLTLGTGDEGTFSDGGISTVCAGIVASKVDICSFVTSKV